MDAINTEGKKFGTFWYGGSLSGFERACVNSLVSRGYDLTVFSYEKVEGIPEGVHSADASTIIDKEFTNKFLINGKPHLGHFSDIFRYMMIVRKDLIWIDLDMIMIDNFRNINRGNIVVKEEQGGINGAILYVEGEKNRQFLIDNVMKLQNRNLRWGETGPLLLEKLVKEEDSHIKLSSYKEFYPVEHYNIYKAFLPEFRDECAVMCREATMVHLFNNILVKMGIWKDLAPPKGSFLYEILEKSDGLKFFKDVYPPNVMKNMIQNYLFRLNGKELGIKSIVREAIPSLIRTYRHYNPKQG